MREPTAISVKTPKCLPLEEKFSNYALRFNGLNSYVNLNNNALLDPLAVGSFEIWFRKPLTWAAGSGNEVLFYKEIILNGDGDCISLENGGRLAVRLNLNSVFSVKNSWEALKWHNVIVTWNGVTRQIFINGVLDTSVPNVNVPGVFAGQNAALGCYWFSNNARGWFFNGWMTENRLHNYVFTLNDAERSWRRGVARVENTCVLCLRTEEGAGVVLNDLSGIGIDATVVGTSWDRTKKYELIPDA